MQERGKEVYLVDAKYAQRRLTHAGRLDHTSALGQHTPNLLMSCLCASGDYRDKQKRLEWT